MIPKIDHALAAILPAPAAPQEKPDDARDFLKELAPQPDRRDPPTRPSRPAQRQRLREEEMPPPPPAPVQTAPAQDRGEVDPPEKADKVDAEGPTRQVDRPHRPGQDTQDPRHKTGAPEAVDAQPGIPSGAVAAQQIPEGFAPVMTAEIAAVEIGKAGGLAAPAPVTTSAIMAGQATPHPTSKAEQKQMVDGDLPGVAVDAGAGDVEPKSELVVDAKVPKTGGKAQVSLRSEYSQAAAILEWKSAETQAAEPAVPTVPMAPDTQPQPVEINAEAADQALPPESEPTLPDLAAPQPLAAQPSAMMAQPPAMSAALPKSFHPLVDQIVQQSTAPDAAAGPDTPARTQIVLQPAELGRIRFALSGSGDQLTISVQVEQRDTLALLQRHLPDLRAELAREGLGQASLSFGGWGAADGQGAGQGTGQGQSDGSAARWQARLDLDPADPAPDAPRPALRTALPGGVDLRF